jgi:putative salt-induced outer membrane protein
LYDNNIGQVFGHELTNFRKKEEMMRGTRFLTVLLIVLVFAPGTRAEEKKWSDEGELSFVDTGGNTDVTTLSAKNLLKYKFTNKLQGAWKLGVLYGESDGEKNAESYFTELRLDYQYTKRLYSYAIAGWMQDEFAGFDSRYYLGPGVGYKFLSGPNHFLVGEAGLSYVKEEYIDDTDKDYLQGRAFAQYKYAFTEKNRFSQSVEFLYDFDDSENYNVNSETAVISALSDYLSLKTSYVVKYDNQPVPETLEETDTVLAVTLVVNF